MIMTMIMIVTVIMTMIVTMVVHIYMSLYVYYIYICASSTPKNPGRQAAYLYRPGPGSGPDLLFARPR